MKLIVCCLCQTDFCNNLYYIHDHCKHYTSSIVLCLNCCVYNYNHNIIMHNIVKKINDIFFLHWAKYNYNDH